MPVVKSKSAPVATSRASLKRLRQDPTRTTTLQRKLGAELRRRFRDLRSAVSTFLVSRDALDLAEHTGLRLIGMAEATSREFRFNTDPQKLEAFKDWLAQQVKDKIFAVAPGTDPSQPWLSPYVESAYRRGITNAFIASRATRGDYVEANLGEFLTSAFSLPVTMSKVRLLYLRAFTELEGITNTMGTQVGRILAQGLVDGSGPLELARRINGAIKSISRSRALMIARTELVRAHAEGQLDTFRELGVEVLGLRAEWSTAGDDRVCTACHEQEGKTFTLEQASGLIPFHPQCRCSWVPSTITSKRKKTG